MLDDLGSVVLRFCYVMSLVLFEAEFWLICLKKGAHFNVQREVFILNLFVQKM